MEINNNNNNNNKKRTLTITNTCTIKMNDRVIKVLQEHIDKYNELSKTTFTLAHIKSITIRPEGLLFFFDADYMIFVLFKELLQER